MRFSNIYDIAIFAAFIGILPLPYVYYTFLRFFIMFVCGFAAYRFFKLEFKNQGLIFMAIAILFNPIAPFFFSKFVWAFVDFMLGVYLWRRQKFVKSHVSF